MKFLLLGCVLLGLSVSTFTAAQAGYKRVGVCRIVAEPGKNDLQYVAVDADLVIARPHGVVLIDQHCPARGLAVDFPIKGEEESVKNLERSIRNGEWPEESTGRFCGKITRDPKTKRAVLSLRLALNLQPKSGSTTQPDVTNPIAPKK